MATSEEADFEQTAKLTAVWQITARQLIVAANCLRDGHDAAKAKVSFYASRMPILLLLGFAAENLVKGLLVARGTPPTIPNAKTGSLKLNDEMKSHNLEKLCDKAGVTLDDADREVLANLSWTVGAGKYPVGTKPAIVPDDPTPVWLELTNIEQAYRILHRLEDALRATGQQWALEETDPDTRVVKALREWPGR